MIVAGRAQREGRAQPGATDPECARTAERPQVGPLVIEVDGSPELNEAAATVLARIIRARLALTDPSDATSGEGLAICRSERRDCRL